MLLLRKNLRSRDPILIYYIGTFLMDLSRSFIFAIYAIFLYTNGLNLLQVNLVNFAYMISIFSLEVPTGAFADSIGRKRSVVISAFLLAVGMALYPIYHSFWIFIIAEVTIAISSSFSSGAFDAWMVDSSLEQGFTGKVDFVFAQANVISKAAAVVGGLLGAYIAIANIGLPFYIGAIIGIIAMLFFIIFMKNDKPKIDYSIKQNFLKIGTIARDSIKYAISHKVIIWLLVGAIASTFIFQPMNMYWNIHFNDMAGNKIWLMGWFWAFISIAMMLGAFSVKEFLKRGKDYTFLMILVSLGIFIPVNLSAVGKTLFIALPPFLIYELVRGIEKPVQQAYVNKYAEPEKRATIFSFEAMVSCLGAAGGLLFFGYIAKISSVQVSWVIAATLALLIIPIYLIARKKELLQ